MIDKKIQHDHKYHRCSDGNQLYRRHVDRTQLNYLVGIMEGKLLALGPMNGNALGKFSINMETPMAVIRALSLALFLNGL